MKIKRMITNVNRDVTDGRNVDWLVVHWVGSVSSARNNGKYFKNVDRGASAHYFVDDNEIVQVVREKDIAWAVGSCGLLDQGSMYAQYGGKYFGKCTNHNSISIEMCCKQGRRGIYISDQTIANTAWLVQALQKRLKIDDAHVIRHFDVNGKLCPLPYCDNEKWTDLKRKLTGQEMKVQAKGRLIVRSGTSLKSDIIKRLETDKVYKIDRTNLDHTRGHLVGGGWITITSKYVRKVK